MAREGDELRYEFASDNTAGIAPEALSAIIEANTGFSGGYGIDPTTARAGDLLRRLFDADAEVHFVATGTAANAIVLASVCRAFESVLVHSAAHVVREENGAPSHFGDGLLLQPLFGPHGRVRLSSVRAAASKADTAHAQNPAALSLTNPTEYGTLYPLSDILDLVEVARSSGLYVHLDGARLANAVAAGLDPKALARCGVDVLVIGGTKSGMAASEAILIFNPTLSRRFGARLKQNGQLPSKARFLAAPWVGMIETGAWVDRARHANSMAQRLAGAMPFPIVHPVETNGVFVRMDNRARRDLQRLGWAAFGFPDKSVRFMCSWATNTEQIEELTAALQTLA